MTDIKQKIINTGKALLALHLQNSHSGNISVRVGQKIYITKTGTMKGHLNKKDIINFDIKESLRNVPRASSEAGTHQGILQYDQAVIHTHSIASTLLSYIVETIDPVDWLGSCCLKSIPIKEFEKPVGSPEMEKQIPEILSHHRAMVVKAHGPFVRGSNLEEVLRLTCLVDCSSKILLHLKMMGRDLKKIDSPVWPPDLNEWRISLSGRIIRNHKIVDYFKMISSDIFMMQLSPFFTGSISVRDKDEMVFSPNASSPIYFSPAIIKTSIKEEEEDFFQRLHQSVYLRSEEKSVIFTHSPYAMIQSISAQIENRNLIIPIDAEGKILYPGIPILHPELDIKEIVKQAIEHRMVVLSGIGVLSVGDSLHETLHHCSSLKNICKIMTWVQHLENR